MEINAEIKNQLLQTQIQCMGMHLDHKQEYRRAWLCYVLACLIALLCMVIISYAQQNFVISWEAICECTSYFLITLMSTISPMSFTISLCNIHKRFALLNFLLRYFSNFRHFNILLNFLIVPLLLTLFLR